MYKIKTLNNISSKGLQLFDESYEVSEAIENPQAILVRSAKVDTDEFEGLLAVARAGAGVNNITIDKASAKGVCVFNTPGANANAVAELVMTALGMAIRNVHKAAEWVSKLDVNSPEYTTAQEIKIRIDNYNETFDFFTYSAFISKYTGRFAMVGEY